jgi:hypothetical protein
VFSYVTQDQDVAGGKIRESEKEISECQSSLSVLEKELFLLQVRKLKLNLDDVDF